MTVVAIACCLFLSAQDDAPLPRELALAQETPQDPYPPLEPKPAPQGSSSFVDLDWLELNPSIGIAVYSPKYRADPAAALSLLAHAPLPWLSPASDPTGEYFGAFASVSFASIDRDLSPTVDDRKGIASFYSLGMDYSFLRDSTWILVARAGVMYAYYNGIADLNSGVGGMAGLSVGIQITGKMGLTYSPDVLFGESGSLIVINTVGLLIQF